MMQLLFDSFWRAAAYTMRPRVALLSLLPLVVVLVLATGLAYFYWDAAAAGVAAWLESSTVFSFMWGWLVYVGVDDPSHVFAPVVVALVAAPIIIVLTLLAVSFLTTPAALRLVAAKRFPALEQRGADSFLGSLLLSVACTVIALVALVVSLPLWLIPPLVLIVPPLIWGWLTYRVMSYDALSMHASAAERKALMRRHRMPLLAMGVVCGYLSAAPAIVWASLTLFAVAFAILLPIGLWIYTMVFAFSSLWFTHYCLAALDDERSHLPAGRRPARRNARAGRAESTPVLPHER